MPERWIPLYEPVTDAEGNVEYVAVRTVTGVCDVSWTPQVRTNPTTREDVPTGLWHVKARPAGGGAEYDLARGGVDQQACDDIIDALTGFRPHGTERGSILPDPGDPPEGHSFGSTDERRTGSVPPPPDNYDRWKLAKQLIDAIADGG